MLHACGAVHQAGDARLLRRVRRVREHLLRGVSTAAAPAVRAMGLRILVAPPAEQTCLAVADRAEAADSQRHVPVVGRDGRRVESAHLGEDGAPNEVDAGGQDAVPAGNLGERGRHRGRDLDDAGAPHASALPQPFGEVVAGVLGVVAADAAGHAVRRDVVGIGVEHADERRQQLRVPQVVVVEEDAELGPRIGRRPAAVAGLGDTDVVALDEPDARVLLGVALDDVSRGVRGRIVEDDDLPPGERLPDDAVERAPDVPLGVVRRYDDRDAW